MDIVFIVFIVLGLMLLAWSCTTLVRLVRKYEARIKALEAQLEKPCPACQEAARGEAWGQPVADRGKERG